MNALWVDFGSDDFLSQIEKPTKNYFNEVIDFLRSIKAEENIICYTSGSTSSPKEIIIPLNNAVNAAKLSNEYFGITSDSSLILPLHIKHIGARMLLVRAFVSGAKVLVLNPSKSINIPEKFQDNKFSFISVSPIQLIDSINNNPTIFDNIEKCLIGGSPVTPFIEHKIKSLDTSCQFYESFGMTETMSHFALRNISQNEHHFTTLNGYNTSYSEDGTLALSHPDILPVQIITNDIVNILNANQFEWKGRADNTINTSGIKVNPEELEARLSAYIQERFIISSIPDDVLGQKIVLIINSNKDSEWLKNLKTKSDIPAKMFPKSVFYTEKWHETENFKPKRDKILQEVYS